MTLCQGYVISSSKNFQMQPSIDWPDREKEAKSTETRYEWRNWLQRCLSKAENRPVLEHGIVRNMRSYWIGFVDTEVMISAKVLESGLFEVVKSALSCCNAIAIPKLQPVC